MSPRKRRKLTCSISNLPDSLLAKIFSYLLTKERFQASAVCKKWLSASKIPWSDIKRLNLRNIPSDKINPVLSLCTAAKEVISKRGKIILDDKAMPPTLSQLEALKLYDVCFVLQDSGSANRIARKHDRLLIEYFGHFPNLRELIWHNIISVDSQGNRITGKQPIDDSERANKLRAWFPTSWVSGERLRRLRLSHRPANYAEANNLLAALSEMQGLECFHLSGGGLPLRAGSVAIARRLTDRLYKAIGRMSKLRELCLANAGFRFEQPTGDFYSARLAELAEMACEKLLELEVLIFASWRSMEPKGISQLIACHPTLKILVIAGQDMSLKRELEHQPNFAPILLPRRTRLSPIDERPLPFLRVFIGGPILRCVRIFLPEPEAAEFTEIDRPMSYFLAKPEVADVFNGVWVASTIREGASKGLRHWGGKTLQDRFYSIDTLQFCQAN